MVYMLRFMLHREICNFRKSENEHGFFIYTFIETYRTDDLKLREDLFDSLNLGQI